MQVSEGGGGGFASVRTRNFDPPLQLGAYDGLELRLRGDGQRYKCAPNQTATLQALLLDCRILWQKGVSTMNGKRCLTPAGARELC